MSLFWKKWDERFVVYNSASGCTHVLDAFGALLLQSVCESAGSTDEIVVRLGELLSLPVTQDFREKLQLALNNFEDLGLLESVSS